MIMQIERQCEVLLHQESLNANMGYSCPQNHVKGFCFGCSLCLPEMKFPYKVYFKVKVPSKQKMY